MGQKYKFSGKKLPKKMNEFYFEIKLLSLRRNLLGVSAKAV